MNKNDYIKYWKRVNLLFKNRDFVFALFCAHLTLEKLIKAHWVKDNVGNHPPKIHNLVYLISKTKLQASENEMAFLEQLNLFQIEGRYPDYRNNLYKVYSAAKSKVILAKTNSIRQWLTKNL